MWCGGGDVNVVQDRALPLESRLIAGFDEPAERIAHTGQLIDPTLQVADTRIGHRFGIVTRGRPSAGQVQQFLDVIERESQLLGAFDEPHDPYRVRGIASVSRPGPLR